MSFNIFDYSFLRFKWMFTRYNYIHYLILILIPINFFYQMTQYFINPIKPDPTFVQPKSYPLSYGISCDDDFDITQIVWEDQVYEKNDNFVYQNITVNGILEQFPYEVYSKKSNIVYPSISRLSAVIYTNGFLESGIMIYGSASYPKLDALISWYSGKKYNPWYIDYPKIHYKKISDTAIILPYISRLNAPFNVMNIFSLLFCLNETYFEKFPIALSYKFKGFDDIMNLLGLKSKEFQFPDEIDPLSFTIQKNVVKIQNENLSWLDVYDGIVFKVPYPFEVSVEPIKKLVQKVSSSLKEFNIKSNKKQILVFTDGDLRLVGKKKAIDYLKIKYESNIEVIEENMTFGEIAARLEDADIAISFTSTTMSMVPFMKRQSLFIEVQKPNIISRSVILAKAFGLNVHIESVSTEYITQSTIDHIIESIDSYRDNQNL